MGWKTPTLIAILWVVTLFILGAALGSAIGGLRGAVIGAVPGALATVLVGFVPAIRDEARRSHDELASLEAEAADAQVSWDAIGEPGVDGFPLGPACLLRPAAEVVAFTGREDELEALRSWRTSAADRSVRIVVGAGGLGKTRLALHMAKESQADGWEWRLVAPGKEARAVTAARGVTSGPVLLVVDYAETRADLGEMLTTVLADSGRIRVLFVARSLGEWWERLIEKSVPAVSRLLTEAAPLQLAKPITTGKSDADLARAAMPSFAKALGVAVPTEVVFELPGHRVPVLVLHAAALVAVLRFSDEPTRDLGSVVADGILDELLEHEARYWRRTASAAGLREEGTVLKPLVAAAALLGASGIGDAADLVARVPDLAESPVADRRRWGRWLYELYPEAGNGQMGSLQPDLLAETLVVQQLSADPDLARRCMYGLAEAQALHALTMLTRAQAHQRHAAELIAHALSEDLTRLAIPAAKVTLQASELAPLLEAALRTAPVDPGTLAVITVALPYPSVALSRARLAAAQRVLGSLSANTDQATIAEWKNRVGTMLSELDRPSDAIADLQDAVIIYRDLAETDSAFRPLLARVLNNVGSTLYRLGRPAEALPAAQEAAAIRQELAALQPQEYLTDLAQSLSNLGTALAGLGRYKEALTHAKEALEISRQLAVARADLVHQHLIVQSLSNLSIWCAEVGDITEGIGYAREAVDISRMLAEINPDRHAPDLAHCLGNLAFHLANAGLDADAYEASQESMAIYRQLTETSSGAYQVRLAASLTSLGNRFTELGDLNRAAEATKNSLTIYRELSVISPGAYQDEIAHCLSNLGAQIAWTGHAAEALKYTVQAVAIYRELAAANPDRYSRHLAQVLYNLSQRFRNTGRLADAIPPLEESIRLRQRISAAANTAKQKAALAHCLNNLSALRADLGNAPAALTAIHEAIAIYRALVREDPTGYRPHLARALLILGNIQSRLGRNYDAEIAHREAAAIQHLITQHEG